MTADSSKGAFEDLADDLDYPMMVVTASAGSRRSGCLVGFATQCSVSPPRFAVYLSDKNRTLEVAREADALGIHFLSTGDEDLAELFGGKTGDEIDKFALIEWHSGSAGVPLIDRCPNRFVGSVLDRRETGDHVEFVLEPLETSYGGALEPLPFQRVKRIEPGHDA